MYVYSTNLSDCDGTVVYTIDMYLYLFFIVHMKHINIKEVQGSVYKDVLNPKLIFSQQTLSE